MAEISETNICQPHLLTIIYVSLRGVTVHNALTCNDVSSRVPGSSSSRQSHCDRPPSALHLVFLRSCSSLHAHSQRLNRHRSMRHHHFERLVMWETRYASSVTNSKLLLTGPPLTFSPRENLPRIPFWAVSIPDPIACRPGTLP